MNYRMLSGRVRHWPRRKGALLVMAQGVVLLAIGLYGLGQGGRALEWSVLIAGGLFIGNGILGLLTTHLHLPTLSMPAVVVAKSALSIFVGFIVLDSPPMSLLSETSFVVSAVGMYCFLSGILGGYIALRFREIDPRGVRSTIFAAIETLAGFAILLLGQQHRVLFIDLAFWTMVGAAVVMIAVALRALCYERASF